jgi:hypothetical protein
MADDLTTEVGIRDWLNQKPSAAPEEAQATVPSQPASTNANDIQAWLNAPQGRAPLDQAQSVLLRQQPPERKDAPQTQAALSTMGRILAPVSSAATGIRASFESTKNIPEEVLNVLGRREGVPFDVSSGAPFETRVMAQLGLNREQVRSTYASLPNVENVTFNSNGEPVLTVKDPQTGQVKDVLANPVGFDPGDFAFIAANLPEMIAGGLAAKGMNISNSGKNFLSQVARSFLGDKGVVASAARGAVGAEAAGFALKDVPKNAGSSTPEPFSDVIKNRAVSATADFLFGTALGTAAKTGARVLTPLQKRGPLQVDAEAAQALWRDKAGIEIDLTPGEQTGNPFLLRTEAFMAQKPGSSGVLADMMAKRRAAIADAQGIMLGVDRSAVPPADVVGQNVLSALQTKLNPLETMIDQRTKEVLVNASRDVQENVANLTKVPTPIATPTVGANLLDAAHAKLDSFRADSRALYSKVYDNPLIAGQGRNIDATPLANDAKKILNSIASVEKPDEVQRMTSFVDSGTRTKLQQLVDADGGFVGLKDLIELRRDIDDDLFRGSAIGGLPERRLGDIRDAITARIKGGLDELDKSGALKADWEAANAHYADNIRKFKDVDIVNMFKDDQQRGALGLNEVVNRAVRDPDRWESYKSFFGTDSDQMKMLRRSYADSIVGRVDGSDTVNGSSFLSRLENAYEKSPQIFDDVFGNNFRQLRTLGEALKGAEVGDINAADLAKKLNGGILTKQALTDLASAQKAQAATFTNKIMEDISKGRAITDAPSKIVDNVVFKAEPDAVTDVVAHLSGNPSVADELRQRTLIRIFEDATGGPTGKETLTSLGLNKFLNDETMVKRLTPVLGADTMDMLRATRDALAPGSVKEEVFGTAGRLSAGSVIAQMERHLGNPSSMFSEMSHIAKSWLVALMYKAGPIRNYITNADFGPGGKIIDKDAFIQGLMVATPAIEDLTQLFGSETSRLMSLQIKGAIDAGIKAQNKKAEPVPSFNNSQP